MTKLKSFLNKIMCSLIGHKESGDVVNVNIHSNTVGLSECLRCDQPVIVKKDKAPVIVDANTMTTTIVDIPLPLPNVSLHVGKTMGYYNLNVNGKGTKIYICEKEELRNHEIEVCSKYSSISTWTLSSDLNFYSANFSIDDLFKEIESILSDKVADPYKIFVSPLALFLIERGAYGRVVFDLSYNVQNSNAPPPEDAR